jgi:hypothetical protein
VPEVLYVLAAVDSVLGEAGAARRRFERCAALERDRTAARGLAERAERDLSAREDRRYRDELAAWRAAHQ